MFLGSSMGEFDGEDVVFLLGLSGGCLLLSLGRLSPAAGQKNQGQDQGEGRHHLPLRKPRSQICSLRFLRITHFHDQGRGPSDRDQPPLEFVGR